MNILIAHPNASYLEATKQILRAQGEEYQTEGATSLAECFQRVADDGFDVLLIDGDLVRDEGLRTFEKLDGFSNSYPIIVTIEEDDTELLERLEKVRSIEYLIKSKGYLSSLSGKIKKVLEGSDRFSSAASTEIVAAPLRENAINEGYFICDRKGRFLSANKILQILTGYTEEEILSLSLTDIMSKEEERLLFERLYDSSNSDRAVEMSIYLVDKIGETHPVEMKIRALRDESNAQNIIGFRGNIYSETEHRSQVSFKTGRIDQKVMVTQLLDIIQLSYTEHLNVLLKRTAEIVCQLFGFRRSTVALLDRRRKAYVKHAMVGYSSGGSNSIERRTIEVPQEVIDGIFTDKFWIKAIYYNQDQRDTRDFLSPDVVERRTQKRRPESEWHKRDLILLKLSDHKDNIFGYISLDDPLEGNIPNRTIFHNLEVFSQLISMAVENYYRFSTLERRSRRLKQVLVTSNIFKLYLSLSELLKEVVWSVKFSLEFQLVSLVLISKKSGQLETKAVATDDKIKLLQINELRYDLKEFSELLKDEYRRGKSYLVSSEEPVLKHLKQIYYGVQSNGHYVDGWPRWAMLLVPIKSREGKIIGFLMADDPADLRMPSPETLNLLEILANQIAIAIDNRMLYVQAKEQINSETERESKSESSDSEEEKGEDYGVGTGGIRKLVDRFLR